VLAAAEIDDIAAMVFLDIAVILVVARLMGRLARRLRQPAVIGEIIGGLALGPSLLGALPGDLTGRLFPTEVRPYLQVVAQLGLVIFMFIIGLELDLGLIKGKGKTAAVISVSSIALPFAMGIPLALLLHRRHGTVNGTDVDLLPFALFIGASMSITAFPVLARILTERGMLRTPIGALTLACAAVDDVMAWSLLAVVLAVVASAGAWDLPRILLESAVFVAAMIFVVKPLLARFVNSRYRRGGELGPEIMAVVLVGMLLASYATAKIGIHQIFGAFLFGGIMPRDAKNELLSKILERLETVSVLLLLPVFFVATGLGANIRGLTGPGVAELVLILLVACAGKFIGASLGARSQGIRGRRAATIGTLMNTRGLTELVILNVGLAFGVLDEELFTMLVVMAVVTTVMAEPLLRVVYPPSMMAADVAQAARAVVGPEAVPRVLVSVGDPLHARRMVDLAAALLAGEPDGEIVITRFSPRSRDLEIGTGLLPDREQVAGWMGDLDELARRVEGHGLRSVVLYQLSNDAAADLVAQAASVGAGWLLVGAPRVLRDEGRAALDRFAAETGLVYRDFLHRVLTEARCDVGVVIHPAAAPPSALERPSIVLSLGSDHDDAAAQLAVRVAKNRGRGLEVVAAGAAPSGRPDAVVEHARAAGVEAEVVTSDEADLVTTVAHRAAQAELVVAGVGPWDAAQLLGAAPDAIAEAVASMMVAVRSQAALPAEVSR
jgi:Kef-type K+ transport system membrane component KefB